jgi:3-phenylpropionate/trans-cinnamate dioxygenase ferredoxin reductase subunit
VTPQAANFLRKAFEDAGAEFRFGQGVAAIKGQATAEGIELHTGESIAADLVVVGVGVSPNLELAIDAGLKASASDGVEADAYLRTADPDIYVAGDIAFFEDVAIGRRWHVEHHLSAKWQGKQAGRNMAGANEEYDRIPYFFSDFLDLHFVLRGDPFGAHAGTLGDVDAGEFVELYGRPDGTLAAGAGISRDEPKLDGISDRLEELIRAKAAISEIGVREIGL